VYGRLGILTQHSKLNSKLKHFPTQLYDTTGQRKEIDLNKMYMKLPNEANEGLKVLATEGNRTSHIVE
jgi:hypothetical protein